MKLFQFCKRDGAAKSAIYESVFRQASDIILKKKMYLDPELQFHNVVRAVATNRTYLWRALRLHGCSFKGFLARFRLICFIEHAWTDEYISLSGDELAERCGFSGRKMLDRYLQKALGITLTRYMEILRQNRNQTPGF